MSAQELGPEIQVDRLMVQMDRQIAAEQYGPALRTTDRIVELQEQHDLELPEPFWMIRAEVAVGAADYLKGMASATRYLELAGREGEHYEAVLELLDEAIARGCTPERMTETLESVQTCLAASADPNGIGEDGRTPLGWAERRADPGITAALIAGGADPASAVVAAPAQPAALARALGADSVVAGVVALAAEQSAAAARRTLLRPVYFDCDEGLSYQPGPEGDDCAALTAATLAALLVKAEILRANPGVRLRMEGHTDERGTIESGIALGNERAEAVIDFLIGLGLSGDRFTYVSYGEYQPVRTDHNEEAWALNRRVEFVIIAGGDSIVGAAPVTRDRGSGAGNGHPRRSASSPEGFHSELAGVNWLELHPEIP